MIAGINELKTLTKHMSCKCKCKIDGRKCNSNQWWNNHKCWCDCKKHICEEEDYIWNPTVTCYCKNGTYVAHIIDDSVITCDEIIKEETKIVTTNFNERNAICKTKEMYILLSFLLIVVPLLIAVSIYCYLIKNKGKQMHWVPFYVANNKSEEVFLLKIYYKNGV